jgi:MAF protein
MDGSFLVLESFDMNASEWILASNSPRRRELLGLFQQPFRVIPANVDESLLSGESALEYVSRLAALKAAEIGKLHPQAGLILAADTTVVVDAEILGKPVDLPDARRMLLQLRGRTHQVYTAISIFSAAQQMQHLYVCCTQVPMRFYADQELDDYLTSRDPLDKAGAYAIQNSKFHPVENFCGCYASVMGLPLCHFAYGLRDFVHDPILNIAAACQNHLQYQCPIYQRILQGEQLG